jgi:hypothetical protein
VLLDTSVLIDWLRGYAPAGSWLASLDDAPFTSEISRVEVLQGVRSNERTATEQMFSSVRWIPLTESISRRAGDLGREYRRSHAGLGVADLVIAATALELQVPLATGNVSHFPMFRSLEAPY